MLLTNESTYMIHFPVGTDFAVTQNYGMTYPTFYCLQNDYNVFLSFHFDPNDI